MEYRIGNSRKIMPQGETTELICPKCGKKVALSVFTNFEARLKAEFPLVKAGNVYFLVCPKCSAVFGVSENKGKLFKKGEKLSIGNFDLEELKKFEI